MNETETRIVERLRFISRWYMGEDAPIHFDEEGEPYLGSPMTNVNWWVCLEVAFGETCPQCWAVGDGTPCVRQCLRCREADCRCTHTGTVRWPGGVMQNVTRRMASEVAGFL